MGFVRRALKGSILGRVQPDLTLICWLLYSSWIWVRHHLELTSFESLQLVKVIGPVFLIREGVDSLPFELGVAEQISFTPTADGRQVSSLNLSHELCILRYTLVLS